jgi:hypothetical protein
MGAIGLDGRAVRVANGADRLPSPPPASRKSE